jgi:hypothetical protein
VTTDLEGSFIMPISGPTSYVPVTEEFLGHWAAVDGALGAATPLVLPGAVNRAGLQTKLNALVAKQADVQAKINAEEVARGDVELKRQGLLLRANQFNDKIRALFANSKWVRALPNVPTITEAQSKFVQPLDDIGNLWASINADPATPSPVSLLGGYLVAAFLADVTALKAGSTALNIARSNTKIAIEERNDLQDAIYDILKNYRQVMPTFFASNHALVESLPRLTPEPGSTPTAVTMTAVWDAATQQAKITWSASTAADLFQYEIRFCAGPIYDTDVENVIGNVSPSAPREFFTAAGLAAVGNTASFKVYVITTTGNEKGSNDQAVARPVAPTP